MDVSPDKIKVGDFIDYRGYKAKVVATWNCQAKSPLRRAPLGFDVEFQVPKQAPVAEGEPPDETVRVRMYWPELSDVERAKLRQMTPDESEKWIAQHLVEALRMARVKLWG